MSGLPRRDAAEKSWPPVWSRTRHVGNAGAHSDFALLLASGHCPRADWRLPSYLGNAGQRTLVPGLQKIQRVLRPLTFAAGKKLPLQIHAVCDHPTEERPSGTGNPAGEDIRRIMHAEKDATHPNQSAQQQG